MATASSSADSIPEPDCISKHGSSERSSQIVRRVTDLFVSAAGRLNEAQVSVFDDVLVLLIERAEARTLAHISDALSGIDTAPRETVRQLALNNDPSVAAPILTKSTRLSEVDLIEIANTYGQRHLLAIACRSTLSEALTDALIRRGDIEILNALAQNGRARFSESGYARIVGNAERDESLTEWLGLRLDIPAQLLRELLAKASDVVRARFLTATRPVAQEKSRASNATSIATMAEQISAVAPNPVDYTQAQGELAALNRNGKLNDSMVNRFAVASDYTNVVAALSIMSEVKIEEVEPLINSGRLYGLIVACRAARLSWSTTTMIIRNRPECAPATKHELEQGLEVFEALSLSAAQWTVRFGLSRGKAQ
jgi:uncharacterized protein (DUF2336 family)